MRINGKNLRGMGFKSSSMFADDQTGLHLHWRRQGNDVVYVDGVSPTPSVGVFRLTKTEAKSFDCGNLICILPGFCSPSAGKRPVKEDCEIIYTGKIRSRKHFEKILATI